MEATSDLNVHVKGDEIFVGQNGRDFFAVYQKAKYEPELVAKGRLYGPREFLTKAWLAANEKAREIGWIV
jgi:hypothetical protein